MGERVKALYDYTKSNNDELSFRRGETIIITQKVEGGWWEGTLRNDTGWFPANLVEPQNNNLSSNGSDGHQDMRPAWRKVVLNNLIESERQHVKDLISFQRLCLRVLGEANLLSEEHFGIFCGNFDALVQLHSIFVSKFEDILRSPSEHQAVGGIFMAMAAEMRSAHLAYCSNHPSAVEVLNQHRDALAKFCSSLGLDDHRGPVIYLTSELSRPFRRLDKYPGMLQELERHMEEFHPDRGNTQRAVKIYTEIANDCTDKRRQKDSELEILKGNIQGYQGPPLETLGKILLMDQLNVRDDVGSTSVKEERFLVLFEDGLLVLSASKRMSCFVYVAHSAITGLKMILVDDVDNAMELWSRTLDKKIVTFGNADQMQQWFGRIQEQIQKAGARLPVVGKSNTLPKPARLQTNGSVSSHKQETMHDNLTDVTAKGQCYKPPIITNPVWSGSCLQPHPPLQPELVVPEKLATVPASPKLPRKFSAKRKEPVRIKKRETDMSADTAKQYEEDMLLLSVVDAYCISSKTRHQVNSELMDSPHVLIPEEEKMFIEGSHGGFIEEKSLVDTVYALKDELRAVSKEVQELQRLLQDEREARQRYQMAMSPEAARNNGRLSVKSCTHTLFPSMT